jgi:hypothetical protein
MNAEDCSIRREIMDMSNYNENLIGDKIYNYILIKNKNIETNEDSINYCLNFINKDFDFLYLHFRILFL